MNHAWQAFLETFPPDSALQKPEDQLLKQFEETLPKELLQLWQQYGFGNYGGGLVKIINPNDYADTLSLWLGEQPGCLAFLMTGFGDLFVYRRVSPTKDDICLLDIHHRRSGSFSTGFAAFVENILTSSAFEEQFLRTSLFKQALARYGTLARDEIFFFAPALVCGGGEEAAYIQKGNAAVHQHLLYEMGAEHAQDGEDRWSQAYQAVPHAFEREDGSLMVNFTLTETVDTILPLAPEKLYEAEETPISLWTLALYSLTKDENLDVLPYHAALQQLRPFVVETRGEYVLLRGLNLQEMQGLAAK